MNKKSKIKNKNSRQLKITELIPRIGKSSVTINHVNDDCMVNIFEYLPVKQKLKIEFVSKRWNELAKRSWSCEKSLNLQSFGFGCSIYADKNENTNYVVNILERCGKYLQNVTLYSYEPDRLHYSLILRKLSEHGSNIKNLIIKDYYKRFDEEDLKLLFSKVNLYSLEIHHLHVKGDCFTTLKPDCIREITINDLFIEKNYLHDFFLNLINLTKINVLYSDTIDIIIDALEKNKCQNISDFSILQEHKNANFRKNFLSLLARQKSIWNLYLGNFLIDKELIDSIPSENLTTLKVSFTENENFFNFNRFEKLTTLTSHNEWLSKHDWQNLCTALYVKEIYIHWSEGLMMYENEKPVNCFKNLQYLETLQIKHSLDTLCIDILIEDVLNCKSLKHLLLSDCKFTIAGLRNVETLPNMLKLKAGSCFYRDSALEQFVDKAPKLQELDISHCVELTTSLIYAIASIKKKRGDNHILKIYAAHCSKFHKLKKVPPSILLCKKN